MSSTNHIDICTLDNPIDNFWRMFDNLNSSSGNSSSIYNKDSYFFQNCFHITFQTFWQFEADIHRPHAELI